MAGSSKSTLEKIEKLQQTVVKKIGNKTLKEYLDVLEAQIKLLEENFVLLHSILEKDLSAPDSVQLPADLKRCDVELQENDLAKYDIDVQEDDIGQLTEDLVAYTLQLENFRGQLESCRSEKKELINQEIDDIENKKLMVELKICNDRLVFYNNALFKENSPEKIKSINEAKHYFELKKCILEIKICDILLKRHAQDLDEYFARRDNGDYAEGGYSFLSHKITEIKQAINNIQRRKRAYKLNQCAYELGQCSLELNSFNQMLLQESRHVLNDLCENIAFKKLIVHANQVLAKLLLMPQVFNPKVLELLQPLVDLLYCFNKIDLSIATVLQGFEKIKLVVAEESELCEQEWHTFCESIVHSANDPAIKRDSFNSRVECVLQGLIVKEIINELSRYKANNGKCFNEAVIEKIIAPLADISIMREEAFNQALKLLEKNKILNGSEISELQRNLKSLFSKPGSDESLSKEAKSIILNKLNKKYLGPLKETYFATFFIFKLIKLEIQRNEKGLRKLETDGAITKVENCISYLMKQHLSQNKAAPYYSTRANPDSALEDTAREMTTEIIVQINRSEPILVSAKDDIPETYIETLQKCKDEHGVVNIEKLFFALFADYSKKGFFLVAHSGRHHRDRVDEILATVKKMIEEDKEVIDWHGVLIALEQWPDNKSLADQGSLKKRIHFFRAVIEQIDGIQKAPVAGPSRSLSY